MLGPKYKNSYYYFFKSKKKSLKMSLIVLAITVDISSTVLLYLLTNDVKLRTLDI